LLRVNIGVFAFAEWNGLARYQENGRLARCLGNQQGLPFQRGSDFSLCSKTLPIIMLDTPQNSWQLLALLLLYDYCKLTQANFFLTKKIQKHSSAAFEIGINQFASFLHIFV
jgi:hypothetical protein